MYKSVVPINTNSYIFVIRKNYIDSYKSTNICITTYKIIYTYLWKYINLNLHYYLSYFIELAKLNIIPCALPYMHAHIHMAIIE